MTMAAGLRSKAKAMEIPPAPNVRAPALDPTCERLGVKLPGATLSPAIHEIWTSGSKVGPSRSEKEYRMSIFASAVNAGFASTDSH